MTTRGPSSPLSTNWKQLQKKLGKSPARASPSPSLKRSASTSPPPSRTIKTVKRQHPPPTTATSTSTTTDTTTAITTMTCPTSLTLWAKENDIAASDLEKAYNLSTTSSPTNPSPTDSTPSSQAGKYISIDCEMVGVGRAPHERSALARVSIVNYHGHVLLDTFVRPKEKVTDWRTWISGVSPSSMATAREFEDVQREVAGLLLDRVVIGHALRNDLDALLLSHPRRDVRDTSRLERFRKLNGGRNPALRVVAKEVLGVEIQGGSHSSVEDARTCMTLYRRFKDEFEKASAAQFAPRGKKGSKAKEKES